MRTAPNRAQDALGRRGQNAQRFGDIAKDVFEKIGRGQLCVLEEEAGEIVAFEERFEVVDAAGQIGKVDAGEGVDGAGVAADGEGVGVFRCAFGGRRGLVMLFLWWGAAGGRKRGWDIQIQNIFC